MSSKVGPRAKEAGLRPSAGGGPGCRRCRAHPARRAVHPAGLAGAAVRGGRGTAGRGGVRAHRPFLGPATILTISLAGTVLGLVLLMTGLGVARLVSAAQRALAGGLLGERLPQLPPHRPAHGALRRVDARLRDGAGWRAVAAAILGLPMAVAKYIAVLWWAYGVFSVTSPVWWLMFRNHPAGTAPEPGPSRRPSGPDLARDLAGGRRRGRDIAGGAVAGARNRCAGTVVVAPDSWAWRNGGAGRHS